MELVIGSVQVWRDRRGWSAQCSACQAGPADFVRYLDAKDWARAHLLVCPRQEPLADGG